MKDDEIRKAFEKEGEYSALLNNKHLTFSDGWYRTHLPDSKNMDQVAQLNYLFHGFKTCSIQRDKEISFLEEKLKIAEDVLEKITKYDHLNLFLPRIAKEALSKLKDGE